MRSRSFDACRPAHLRPARLALLLLALALLVAWMLGPGAGSALACSNEENCADVGISGHAEPQPIRRGEKSTLKITPKNNGPSPAYGIEVHINIPRQLEIKKVRLYGGSHCDRKGTFVQCYMGDFRREQLGVIKIKVKAKKKGTFISTAEVYSQGVEDPNGGNGQVRMTIGVKGRRDN